MDSTGIRNNMSSQYLINSEDFDRLTRTAQLEGVSGASSVTSSHSKLDAKEGVSSSSSSSSTSGETTTGMTKRQICTVLILCFINLINYMDRMTIAGILPEIQCYFGIGDVEGGLLQTAFIASYMVCAPIFGYLGDRYSRRLLMAGGIFVWSLTTLLGSYAESFSVFITMRALVGVGEASYSTIAPTIISDLTVGDMRSKMLALFYFAIPVGSGLGYIVGSETARALGSWHWGLRVTPVAGAVAVLLILLVSQDPQRGESEGAHLTPTSWLDDIKSLCRNKSFMMSTVAATAVAFVAGALSWWGPKFIQLGLATQEQKDIEMDDVSYIFGLTAMLAGLLGVPLGSFLGQRLRAVNARADPLVCGAGMLLSMPFMLAGLFVAGWNTLAAFAVVFFGQILLNLNWSIVADMALYVVIPTRRATAEAFQILVSHALGDAGSPYLIGQVSEILKVVLTPPGNDTAVDGAWSNNSTLLLATVSDDPAANCSQSSINLETADVDFKALQYAMLVTILVEVIGGVFFLLTACYIVEDKASVDRAIAGLDCEDLTPSHRHQQLGAGNRHHHQRHHADKKRLAYSSAPSTPEEQQPIAIII